ncbi:TNT domain-containing protein [Spirillospora sp. NPDC048819]|uniref:TNT domain-containing protein n=1 Tax=Spirillospora sp. NPDC048819 TaxID=3155268 RepID=UPI00341072C1
MTGRGVTARDERIADIEGRVVEFARGTAPPGWRRIDLHCTATVAVNDVALTVLTGEDGIVTAESVPEELTGLLMDLRRAHYLSERGTWFSMVAIIEPESARSLYNRHFDPLWDPPIPVDYWRRDQIVMPRDGVHVPGWLRDRLADRTPADHAAPDPGPLNPAEQMELLSDQVTVLVADHAPPLWTRISGYYQAAGWHVEFPAMTCHRADATTTPWTPPAALAALLDRLRAGTHAFQGSAWSRIDFEVVYDDGDVRCRADFIYDEEPQWASGPSAADVRRELVRFPRDDVPEWMKRRLGAPPEPVTLTDEPPPAREPDWVDTLQHRLDQLRVDRAAYRVRDTADGAWCLLPQGDRWAVFQMRDGERHKEVVFDDTEDAAAHLLGRLLLHPRHTTPDGPFEPLKGEPPLSLLRDRHVVELSAGTEVDRYGGSDGNVAYAARTPYPYRSLPPEWQDRPYHVYRLLRPMETLTGTAVAWFGQPGGGTAHVFRRSIADLLADGALTEVRDA